MRRRLLPAVLVPIAALGACSEMTSVYHTRPMPPDRAITVDAYQRSTYVANVNDGRVTQLRLCAEAAPDAFSALSASLAAEGNLDTRSASLAAALSQSGATIERTQTVNLLRESMYRTCERYLSGGMNRAALIVQAARDQRAMVSVLAIEQLTRTARPAATLLVPTGTSASVPNDDAAALIKQFAQEKSDAGKAVSDADGKYKAALSAGKCDSVTAAPAADATDPTLAEWSNCTQAKATLDTAKKNQEAATARLDKVVAAVGAGGAATASATGGTSDNPAGSGGVSDATLQAVANVVGKIALGPGIDESLMFCISYLSDPPAQPLPPVVDTCNQMIAQRFANDEKLRGGLLNFEVDGTDLTVSRYQPAEPTDAATPLLKAYLAAQGAPAAERTRRVRLAGAIAVRLGLIRDASALTNLVYSGNAEASAQIVAQLRSEDTTDAGRAALAGR